MHAREMLIHVVHAYEMHANEVHAHEVHAHEIRAYEILSDFSGVYICTLGTCCCLRLSCHLTPPHHLGPIRLNLQLPPHD